MVSDVSNSSLLLNIGTSVLKKAKDTNEELAAKLFEGMDALQTSAQAQSAEAKPSSILDIYA